MAMKKTVSPELVAELMDGASAQVVSSSTPRSDDPNFPVWRTPLDKDVIVYFPKVAVTQADGVETYNPLTAHIHSVKKGANGYANYRCISGLSGGKYESVLGYDGSCPFCDGVNLCWDLYNEKMRRKAAEMGIDLENDVADAMKPFRQQFVQEMAIKKCEEYVTFPIVVISETGFVPKDMSDAVLAPYFVTMRKQSFEKNIIEVLTKQTTPIPHPGGLFFKWCYTYDTKGKPATPRDAAKNAQYLPILDNASTASLSVYIAPAEEKAKEFTNAKAAECIIMNEFYAMADIKAEADSILADTRRILDVMTSNKDTPVALPGATAMGNGVSAALASFGVGAGVPAADPVATAAATAPAGAATAQTAAATAFPAGQANVAPQAGVAQQGVPAAFAGFTPNA